MGQHIPATGRVFFSTFGTVAALVLCFSSFQIFAQDQNSDPEEFDAEFEEVIVTGSRIKRRDWESPSPLTTVSREDFEFSGQPTLEEYLNQMPQLQPDIGRTTNNGGDGSAQLNLRGMGAGRTLVLLNGRRLAPSGIGSAVDVNNLPSVLVERAEIITGGASTVYGSDAIAGVVNFITRDDFDGLSFEGSYNVTEKGDSDIWDASLVFGHNLASGNGNITLYANTYDRKSLLGGQRKITSKVWYDDWESGYLQEFGSPTIPGGRVVFPRADFGNGPVRVTWNPDGTPRAFVDPDDRYNYAPINYIQTPLTRYAGGLMATFSVFDDFEAYFEASHTRNEARQTLAEAPAQSFFVVNTDNPVLTPETRKLFEEQWSVEPGFAEMFLTRRMLELGPRIIDETKKYTRFVAGIRGDIGSWSMDAWVTWTDADEKVNYLNDGSLSRMQQGLLVDPVTGQCFDPSDGCVPLDIFGEGRLSAEGVDFIRVDGIQDTYARTQVLASIVATGPLFDLWAGSLDVAVGAEWRRDKGSYKADDQLFTGDTMSFSGRSAVDGTEEVYELYAEAALPLFDSSTSGQYLGLEAGVRYSDYDNAGSVWTWKAGLDWRIGGSVRFRAMHQHAVRAPNLQELFTVQLTETGFYVTDFSYDPCSASSDPVANGNLDKCVAQGIPASQVGTWEATPFYPGTFISGGNPDLKPESSDTNTVGVVFTPTAVKDLTVAVDYYHLKVEDTIGDISPTQICFDPLNTEGVFCDNIRRDGTFNVVEEFAPISNRGLLSTDGIDTQIQYQTELPDSWSIMEGYAVLNLNVIWTHMFSSKSQENITTEIRDCAGYFGWPCWESHEGTAFPENRVTSNLNYASGPLNLHLTWRWVDGMKNAAPLGSYLYGYDDPVLAVPTVSSASYFDLGFGYQVTESLQLRFGINNLMDKKPPNLGDAAADINTDARFYDIFGRTYYFNMRMDMNWWQ